MSVLKNPVLILNKVWIPIRVKDVQKAITLLCRERACVVDLKDYALYNWEQWYSLEIFNGEKYIQSVRKKVKVPSVILLSRYSKIPNETPKLTKRNIFIRDGHRCQYTGKKVNSSEADIDHVIPKSKGGKTVWKNLVVSSKDINRKKGDRTPEEAGLKLKRKPDRPRHHLLMTNYEDIPDSWKAFIKHK